MRTPNRLIWQELGCNNLRKAEVLTVKQHQKPLLKQNSYAPSHNRVTRHSLHLRVLNSYY